MTNQPNDGLGILAGVATMAVFAMGVLCFDFLVESELKQKQVTPPNYKEDKETMTKSLKKLSEMMVSK